MGRTPDGARTSKKAHHRSRNTTTMMGATTRDEGDDAFPTPHGTKCIKRRNNMRGVLDEDKSKRRGRRISPKEKWLNSVLVGAQRNIPRSH